MKLEINVTKRDITLGRKTPSDGHFCPIARAIKRVYPYWNKNSYVYTFGVAFKGNGWEEGVVYPLPKQATEFIYRLDEGGEPFSFEMEAPDKE